MPRSPLALALALILVTACGEQNEDRAAREAFDAFTAAIRAGDRTNLRDMLTADSVPAIDDLLAAHQDRGVAVVAARTRSASRVDLRVAAADGTSTCVVVRENGRWRIDLIESAVATHGVTAGAGFSVSPGADPRAVRDAVLRSGEGIEAATSPPR
ncbi:MAG: hypothetical protein HZB39_04985 [Planctomycetes bacterium]|nr:hypothetical protein [Planctomycetota bacterium]